MGIPDIGRGQIKENWVIAEKKWDDTIDSYFGIQSGKYARIRFTLQKDKKWWNQQQR